MSFDFALFGLKDTLTRTIPCFAADTCACKEITECHWTDWILQKWLARHACTHARTDIMFTQCASVLRLVLVLHHFMAQC